MPFATPGIRIGIPPALHPPRRLRVFSIWATVLCLGAPLFPPGATAQTLEGRLLDGSTDDPIETGLVIMVSTEGDSVGSTITDDEGRFSLSPSQQGSYVLVASAYGYRESTEGVFELGDDAVMTVEYRLAPAPLRIDEIVVELGAGRVREPNLVRRGFVRRMQRGVGRFLTPWEIARSPDTRTSDLLDRLPGVFAGRNVLLQGPIGPCEPTVYLDGILVQQNVDIDGLVPMSQVDAVEIYRRPAQVPVEYGTLQRAGDNHVFNPCGIVLFWTKS